MTSDLIVGTRSWTQPPPPDLLEAIQQHALTVDTAAIYGRGQVETFIGTKLPSTPVITKVMPHLWRSPKSFERHLHHSLQRLQRTAVDVLMLHFPARANQREWLQRLAAAVHSGHAHAIGLSNFTYTQLKEAIHVLNAEGCHVKVVQLDSNVLQAQYMWNHRHKLLQQQGVQLMVFHVLQNHMLSADTPTMMALAKQTGRHPLQLSLRWWRHHGIVPIVGTRSTPHLTDAIQAINTALPDTVITALDRLSQQVLQ